MLRAAPAFSLLSSHGGDALSPASSSSSPSSSLSSSVLRFPPAKHGIGSLACATKDANNRSLSGVAFEPFEEVKKELDLVPAAPHDSLARHKFLDECESAINEQIK